MRRRPLLYVLCTIIAILALLAMHGVSGHSGLELGTAATSDVVVDPLDGHGAGDGHHDGAHHHDGGPCSCPHGTAAMCALIVLAIVAATCRMNRASFVRPDGGSHPALSNWSPDPPVPRSVLALRTS